MSEDITEADTADLDAILQCGSTIRGQLADEMATAARAVTFQAYRRLVDLIGVHTAEITARGEIGLARCETDARGNYQPAGGAIHIVLPVRDGPSLIDLVAFRPDEPTRWALRRGNGWCLGLDDLRGAQAGADDTPSMPRYGAWTGEPLPLAETPLEWLQRGREGACILEWDAHSAEQLRDVHALDVRSPKFAHAVRLQLSKPPRLPGITVRETGPAYQPTAAVLKGGRHAA